MQNFYLIILVKVFSNVQRSGDNVLKSVEKKKKSYFVFEIWSNFLEDCVNIQFLVPKGAQCSETDASSFFTVMQFLVYEIWSIL